MKRLSFGFLGIVLFVFYFSPAVAWHDCTHIAVGAAAQFDQAYNLAAPDVAKLKADTVEEYNHWVDNSEATTITKALIKGQIQKYDVGKEREKTGHLYGSTDIPMSESVQGRTRICRLFQNPVSQQF